MAKTYSQLLFSLIAVFILLAYVPDSNAQTSTTGAIEGRVYDKVTGTGMPGIKVLLLNEDKGYDKPPVTTDKDGRYFFSLLEPGRYRISVDAPGFVSYPAFYPATIGAINTVTITPPPFGLQTAATAQTAQPPATQAPRAESNVAAESQAQQLVDTDNATRGLRFGTRELVVLPLPGVRTFDDLAFLAPGVFPPPLAIGSAVGPGVGAGIGTSGQFSVNGLRSRSNNFTMDGSDDNDEDIGVRRQGFTSLVQQSPESMQAFQIQTLLPEPQYGRNSGAQVNGVSKSGGSGYHGTAYGFFTHDALNSRNPFDLTGGPPNFPITRSTANGSLGNDGVPVTLDGNPLAPANPVGGTDKLHRGQYGLVLGGPIVKGKTFFLASLEHQEINATKESNFAVPTVSQRGFIGSGDVGLQASSAGKTFPVYPTTIVGDAIFSLFPFPNNPRGPYGTNTFTEVSPANAQGTVFSVKLDHNFKAFGKEHTLTSRYNFTDDNTILPVTGEAIFSSLRPLVRTQDVSLFLNSDISARIANQFRVSYGRTSLGFREVRDPFLLPAGKSLRNPAEKQFLLNAPLISNVTLPFIDASGHAFFSNAPSYVTDQGVDTETVTGPLGQVIVSGFSPVGVDTFNFPQGRTNNTFQYADTAIYSFGNQRLTLGFDIRRIQLNSFVDRNFRPLAVFGGEVVAGGSANPFGALFGPDFAAAGAPTNFFQTLALFPDSAIGLREWQESFFVSDQIRFRRNFTVSLGLRFEHNPVPTEVNGKIESTFNSPEVKDLESSVSGLSEFLAGRTKIFKNDANNFGPYISFAWDPFSDGKTAIRGGFGIYYDSIPGAVISQSRSVIPNFLQVNTGGFQLAQPGIGPTLGFFNPNFLAANGTLNTFNQGFFESPSKLFKLLSRFSNGTQGLGFVLPAAGLESPYAEHWSLTVERQFKSDFLLSAAYVGTRGVHLLRIATPNGGPNSIPGTVSALTSVTNNAPFFVGTTKAPQREFADLGSFTSIESDSNSVFHSLQVQLNKRFSHGIQMTTAYTWSHAIDEVSDLFDLAGDKILPQDSSDRRKERADANFDVRHRFVYSAIWDLPFFRGNRALGGWQVSSIGAFQTGQPYSVLFCCDANQDGNLNDRVAAGVTLPGSAPRNLFRAPGMATVDLAAMKYFRVKEGQSLEFRTEFFNLFNRANFGIPVHQLFFGSRSNLVGTPGQPPPEAVADVLAGKRFVDTRVPARTIQFALKYTF